MDGAPRCAHNFEFTAGNLGAGTAQEGRHSVSGLGFASGGHLFSKRVTQMSGCYPLASTAKERLPCQKHPGGDEEKRMAVRLTIADGASQCAAMLYHDLLLRAAI